MCGIIGIIGREAAPQLIDALKRLEYRGYDSAGVATLERGKLTRRRAEGKLKNLEGRLEREPLKGTIGIGHTRWRRMAARPRTMRIRMPLKMSRWCTTAL
jgi:glucosamine--fructose-6-phosphate aminotransferase (isomerizing)